MPKDFLNKQLVDHYIQAEILKRLAYADTATRFSDLKDEGIENSLFMYHANKLINRGLIAKSDEGFVLTPAGARWSNHAGILAGFQTATPRPLVQFIIYGPDETILVTSRNGQLRQLLNSHMLPGDMYHYDLTLEENAAAYLQKLFGDQSFEPKLATNADFIHRYKDGFTHHVISYIFEVTIANPSALKQIEGYDMNWVPLGSVKTTNRAYSQSPFLPMVIEKRNSLLQHEAFVIEE